jgi:SAM-dependent methyltransferase
MNKKEKEKTIERYRDRFKKYGISPKSLGWKDRKSQILRFKILSEIANLDKMSILDVGCGFGDFYKFLLKNGYRVKYTGFDIVPEFIEIAKRKYPECEFILKDILQEKFQKKFDYVFSSGIFNAKISKNYSFLERMLEKMWTLAKKGISFNMMSDYVDYFDETLFYYSPEKVFNLCRKFTRKIILRHDYPLYEFTIYLYK